jgi:outer membrane protein assembly factor BamB
MVWRIEMKNGLIALALIVGVPALLVANGGMSGMGSGGGMMGGSGMMVVADDGSLLVTNMDMAGMMGGGTVSTTDREIVNVGSNGSERWRVSFSDGWPMMPVTNGGLVVVVLMDDWFMGSSGMGDGGWGSGGMGGGMKEGEHGPGDGESVLVALDLDTGNEQWRTTITGDMASMAQFSPDGSQIYLSAVDMGSGGGMGHGSMRQGEAVGTGFMSSSTIVAFDRSGNQLWTYDVGGE